MPHVAPVASFWGSLWNGTCHLGCLMCVIERVNHGMFCPHLFGTFVGDWLILQESETFSDNAIAAELNTSFVNIKVDREERPDVDRLYMSFVQATTGCSVPAHVSFAFNPYTTLFWNVVPCRCVHDTTNTSC